MLEKTTSTKPGISSVCTSIRLCHSQKIIAVKAYFIITVDPVCKIFSTIMKNRLSDTLESSAFAYRSKTQALEILLLKTAARSFSLKKPQLVELQSPSQYTSHRTFITTE